MNELSVIEFQVLMYKILGCLGCLGFLGCLRFFSLLLGPHPNVEANDCTGNNIQLE